VKYTLGRGSTYDYNDMIYAYNYPYNASPMFEYLGVFTKPQILCDTYRHWTINPNTLVYGYYETNLASYDALNNLTNDTALYVDSSFYPNMVHTNNFIPTTHVPYSTVSSNWVGGTIDSAFKQYFTYNSSNLLTKDSTYELHLGVWRLASKSLYTYDISNNLTQVDCYANLTDTSFLLPLLEQIQYMNTYDGSNRLATVQANYRYGAGLSAYTRDTFGYTGTYPFHTSWRQHQYDTINSYWAPMLNMTKILNGTTGRPDTVYIKTFDSLLNTWVPQTMDVMTYNVSLNPTVLKDYEWNWTAYPATPNFTTRYYYETYMNTLGVNEVGSTAKLYPNPATNMITVTGLNTATSAPLVISFINAAGQAVSRERTIWQGQAQVSVRHLIPGVYQLVIQDINGDLLHRESIVKP
jgi:hypothetical protein